jgi:hypothetical protein
MLVQLSSSISCPNNLVTAGTLARWIFGECRHLSTQLENQTLKKSRGSGEKIPQMLATSKVIFLKKQEYPVTWGSFISIVPLA